MKSVFFLLLFASAVSAQSVCISEFDVGEGLSLAGIIIDWKQSRNIGSKPGYKEQNFILGKKPSRLKFDIYMVSAVTIHYYVAKKLPRHWRYAFWGATIALQTSVIWTNHKNGLKVF